MCAILSRTSLKACLLCTKDVRKLRISYICALFKCWFLSACTSVVLTEPFVRCDQLGIFTRDEMQRQCLALARELSMRYKRRFHVLRVVSASVDQGRRIPASVSVIHLCVSVCACDAVLLGKCCGVLVCYTSVTLVLHCKVFSVAFSCRPRGQQSKCSAISFLRLVDT